MSYPDNQNNYQDNGEWFGVSYQNGEYMQAPEPPHRSQKRRKMRRLLIVACALVCVAFAAAFGGAMLARIFDLDIVPELNPATSNPPTISNGAVYDSNDQNYNFSTVTLQKNDGSLLVGSKNGSAGENKKDLMTVAEEVKDSVVEITTTYESYRGTITAGAGSGVIIHADGIIVTNHHVIQGSDDIFVRLTNGNTYRAYLRGTNEDGDIAVIKITPQEPLTVAKLGCSDALRVGEEVIAIGNPLGELGGTVTNGIISALGREVLIDGVTMTLLQTNAAINSGNSGGGLFNMAGELIGVVNAKYSAAGVEGLGFAIPIDTAYQSISSLLSLGYIPGIPSVGVSVEERSVTVGFMKSEIRLYVYDADNNTVLQKGDQILSIGGTAVSSASTFKQIIRQYKVGDTVEIVVLRDGNQQTLRVTLVEYVPTK